MKRIPTNWSDTTNTTWESSGYKPVVFQGLFKNPDYRNTLLFLRDDPQTQFTDQVIQLAGLVRSRICKKKLIKHLYNLLEAAAPVESDRRTETSAFKRTASNILTMGYAEGCADRAIAFAALARARGIPTLIVDTAHLDWIQDGAKIRPVKGHFFVEVKLNGKWKLIDTTFGWMYSNYDIHNYYLPNKHIAFSKSRSPVDVGVENEFSHRLLQRVAFWGTEIFCYRDPAYREIDLKNKYLIRTYEKKIKSLGLSVDKDKMEYTISPDNVREIEDPIEIEDLSNIS